MMTTQTQTDTILDAINKSDKDQLDDVSSQESMDYHPYQKAAIIASLEVCGGVDTSSNDLDSSNSSNLDMEIVLNTTPKQRQKPQGKKLAQQKPSGRKKIKPGNNSDEKLDISDSDLTTCGM
jgi:hypothetical protein